MCFDRTGDSNAMALYQLLDQREQLCWKHHTTRRRADVRTAITAAYTHLIEQWHPGDGIYLFGAGSGAACAQALARLLGTIGVLDGELRSYMLATYALPRTPRSDVDWRHVSAVAAGLADHDEVAVPVRFLGLWDTARVAGTDGAVNAEAGRHAMAIDDRPTLQRVSGVDEVWFRGSHRDITSGSLTLDWMLDGAVQAGLRVSAPPPAQVEPDHPAFALPLRRVPDDAVVHASVEMHVRSHPQYWRRLPARVMWTDRDWLDRGERLMNAGHGLMLPRQPLAAAS